MAGWQFDDGPVAVGIDVGWSKTKKSCAVAVLGLTVPPGARDWTTYSGGTRPVAVGLFRYADLLPEIGKLFALFGEKRSRAVVVVDGPIGPIGKPTANRAVDAAFTRGEFNGRMQPSPVATGEGPKYASVTDAVVRGVYDAAGVPYRPGLWAGTPTSDLTVCETHPTVGLALLLPKQDRRTLPSRNAARVVPAGTPGYSPEDPLTVRAKSDWYWQLGAGRWVSNEALGCPAAAEEGDHERVAGLYCVAVAGLLATAPDRVVSIGHADGVYVIPAAVDRGWETDLSGLVWRGTLSPADHSSFAAVVSAATPATVNAPFEPVAADEPDEVEKGDSAYLILNDAGGVWRKHNNWLHGLRTVAVVRAEDGTGELIRLRPGNRADLALWVTADECQGPLGLAQRRGFVGDHLSNACKWQIPITVLEGESCQTPR